MSSRTSAEIDYAKTASRIGKFLYNIWQWTSVMMSLKPLVHTICSSHKWCPLLPVTRGVYGQLILLQDSANAYNDAVSGWWRFWRFSLSGSPLHVVFIAVVVKRKSMYNFYNQNKVLSLGGTNKKPMPVPLAFIKIHFLLSARTCTTWYTYTHLYTQTHIQIFT